MEFGPHWKRFVGKVSATLQFTCFEAEADEVTKTLGIQPTWTSPLQAPPRFTPDGFMGAKQGCVWHYETSSQVSSREISEHVRQLLRLFSPLKSRLEEMRPSPRISVRVLWETTILGLTGPQLGADCIAGLAKLGASVEFYVVKIDEVSNV